MAHQRKRIGLLFCGGTTLNAKDGPGDSVRSERDIPKWLANFSELQLIADVEPYFIYGGVPSGVGKREWLAIVDVISKHYNDVDGFLITHGLDTLTYTANVLAFLMQRLGKPVVVTGSITLGRAERSTVVESAFQQFQGLEAKANLVNAAQVAVSDLTEVAIIFGNRILRACRTVRTMPSAPTPFEAIDHSVLGKIDFGVRLFADKVKRPAGQPRYFRDIDTKVAVVTWQPGVDLSALRQSLSSALHGVIVHVPESNYIPDDLYQLLQHAQKHGVTVVLDAGIGPKRIKQSDFVIIDRISPVALLAKLMWALGKSHVPANVKKLLEVPVANEFVKA